MSARTHDIRRAVRLRLMTAQRIATTGTVFSVEAPGAVYTYGRILRSAGSFLDEGFEEGDEITITGFLASANNGLAVVLSVTATTLALAFKATLPVAESSGASVTLSVKFPFRLEKENRIGNPTTGYKGTPFGIETLLGSSRERMTIGDRARIETRTLYQLDLCYPVNVGTNAVDKMADTVLDHCYAGLQVSAGGTVTEIRAANRGSAFQDGQYYRLPITFTLRTISYNPV